jgi:hypothetical protein
MFGVIQAPAVGQALAGGSHLPGRLFLEWVRPGVDCLWGIVIGELL